MGGESRQSIYGDIEPDIVESRLADLCDSTGGVQTGPFGSQLHKRDYVPHGTPIITVEHLGENRIIHKSVPCITDEDRDRLSRYILEEGDIVFSRVGSVDRCALVRDSEVGWLFSGRCLRVRTDRSKIDPGYLSYFFGLPSFKEHIRAIAVGATMPSLNTQLLSDVIITHPRDLIEQRAIAHILGTLDEKIELNRRMNETLEAIARAIFKSWFVDFDPVRAKAEEGDTGLPMHIADLFPDRFVDSELGEIPEGWKVKPLDEIANYQNGLALQKYPTREGEDYLFRLKIRELRQGYFDNRSERSSTGIHKSCIVNDGDVIFSWSGSLLIDIWTGGTGALNQHLFKVTSDEFPRWFYYFWSKYHLESFQKIAAGKATTMGHIQRHHLSEALTCVPQKPLLLRAHEIINPLVEALVDNRIESRIQAELRDLLVPKLISGELRIHDTESIIGRHD